VGIVLPGRFNVRVIFFTALLGLTLARSASANCSHHIGGGGTGGTTTPSGPDWNATCIRWERITDAGTDGGEATATAVAPGDGPSDGGTDGLICVETTQYGAQYGCGCEVATAAMGASLLALIRVVRRRRPR
jgi:hypothetical protein